MCAFDDDAAGHDAGVAHAAGEGAQLDFAFLANDVMGEGEDALGGEGHIVHCVYHAGLRDGFEVETGIVLGGVDGGSVEDELSRLNEVGFGFEFGFVGGVVPEDDGVLLPKPLHVAGGLTTWGVDGVLLVDGADWDAVVVVGGHGFGRAEGVGEGDFEGRHFFVVPHAGDGGFGGGFGGLRCLGRGGSGEGDGFEKHYNGGQRDGSENH